ncbi:MAG: DNA primase [Pirellulales bacterium]
MTLYPIGFRVVGPLTEPRRLVDASDALAAYAACDSRARCDKESYLSLFRFTRDFAEHLKATCGSTAGFSGPCWSDWQWWDIDSEELGYAHKDAGALAAFLVERYGVEPADLLIFFSGSKGFHIGLPTALWLPLPSLTFHRVARRFAENVAALASVTIDMGIYDRVRALRAPNSKHGKTGRHKRRLTYDELLTLPLSAIVELAAKPAPFDLPTPTRTSETADADWQAAREWVVQESEGKAARRVAANGSPTLNRATLTFLREGAKAGDRHRFLFSAAANLAEFGCPPALALALLEESALDSGLSPKEVRRQIECGLAATPSLSAPPQDPPAVLPPTPPPLPPGAVGAGTLDTPCRCGSTEYVEMPIPEGRTRRDCRKCKRFAGWGRWHDQGGPTP